MTPREDFLKIVGSSVIIEEFYSRIPRTLMLNSLEQTRIFAVCWLLLMISASRSLGTDTDGDGLLDVLDARGSFNANGGVFFNKLGIEDLDGVNNLFQVQTLDLCNNAITSIESGDFRQLNQLATLSLCNNAITSIESGDFEGLSQVRSLNLNDNSITNIEGGNFAEMTNLSTLRLAGNAITSLENSFLEGPSDLTFLSLYGNNIASIESGSLAGLTNLKTLILGGNGITSIENADFEGPTQLVTLDLNDNAISSIENDDFERLFNLHELYLKGNSITSIESRDFGELPKLITLSLSDNMIERVENKAFQGLESLQRLNLDSNAITSIETEALTGLPNLQFLSLGNNRITTIESGAFAGLPDLQELWLGDNELSELNFEGATFENWDASLGVDVLIIDDDEITRLILDDATLSVGSLDTILAATTHITDASLIGLNFSGAAPANFDSLFEISSLNNIWVDGALFDAFADEFNLFAEADGKTVIVISKGDCNQDGELSDSDLLCLSDIEERDVVLAALNRRLGDLDGDGNVGFLDFLVLANSYGKSPATYAEGNIDLQKDGVAFLDFLALTNNFDQPPSGVVAVPETSGTVLVCIGLTCCLLPLRRFFP